MELFLKWRTGISLSLSPPLLGGLDVVTKTFKVPGSGLIAVQVSQSLNSNLLLCITNCCAFCVLLSIVLSFPVSYTNWNNADAKESGAAHCAAMMRDGRWQSVKCDHSHIMLPYICEKGIVVTCSAELLVVTSMI